MENPIAANGWSIYFHGLILDQIETLTQQVEALKAKDPASYINKGATLRLAAIFKLMLTVIPQDPTLPEYRQGETLGHSNKHWFRAKFFQQYRLFFRYHTTSKVIVYAWVNDEGTKRAYESKKDAYRVFRKMLAGGRPPGDWNVLLREAKKETSRAKRLVTQPSA